MRTTVAALSLAAALITSSRFFLACSSNSNGGGGGGGATSATDADCRALCDQQAKATGCSPGGVTDDECHQLCDAIVPGFSANCAAKADAYYQCGAKATWMCSAMSNLPQPANGACMNEIAAYSQACGAAGDAGGGG